MSYIFFLIFGLFAAYAFAPLLDKALRNKPILVDAEREELLFRKEEVLDALNDLEYDLKMKKMSVEDYKHLKEGLTQQAVELMKKLDDVEGAANKNAVNFQPRKAKAARKVRA